MDVNLIPCGRKVVGLSLTFACNGGFELEEMRRADRRMGTDVPRSVAPPSLPASSIYDLHKSYQNVTFIKIPSKICCDHLCWLELLISPEVLGLVSNLIFQSFTSSANFLAGLVVNSKKGFPLVGDIYLDTRLQMVNKHGFEKY